MQDMATRNEFLWQHTMHASEDCDNCKACQCCSSQQSILWHLQFWPTGHALHQDLQAQPFGKRAWCQLGTCGYKQTSHLQNVISISFSVTASVQSKAPIPTRKCNNCSSHIIHIHLLITGVCLAVSTTINNHYSPSGICKELDDICQLDTIFIQGWVPESSHVLETSANQVLRTSTAASCVSCAGSRTQGDFKLFVGVDVWVTRNMVYIKQFENAGPAWLQTAGSWIGEHLRSIWGQGP